MADAFQFADELGPAKVLHMLEPALGMRAILVVDNVATGPSIGGVRMAEDVGVEECFRLARAMTVPGFIANAGGVICAAVGYRGGTQTAAFETIADKIRSNADQIREQARCAKIQPRRAAVDLALRRLRSRCGITAGGNRPALLRLRAR